MQQEVRDTVQIIKSSILGVVTLDEAGNILNINERALSLLEISNGICAEETLDDLFDHNPPKLNLNEEIDEGLWSGVTKENNLLHLHYIYTKLDNTQNPEEKGCLILTKQPTPNLRELRNDHRFGPLFDSSIQGLAVMDRNRRFCDINEAALELLDYSRQQFIGKTWKEIGLVEETMDIQLIEVIADLHKNGNIQKFEAQVIDGRGNAVDLLLSADSFLINDQRFYVISINDISSEKKARQDLIHSHQQLSNHLNNSPLGVIEFDKDMQIIQWSGKCEEIFGWTENEVVGQDVLDINFIYVEDLATTTLISEELRSGAVNANVCYNRNYTKNGKIIHCQWYNSVVRNLKGEVQSVMSLVLDVTEQSHLEQSLKKSEKQLSLFFDNSLYGFFFMMLDQPINWKGAKDKEEMIDYTFEHQKITRVNKALLDQYGAAEEGFVGLTPSDFFQHDLAEGKKIWTKFFDEGKMTVDTDERRFDGSQIWVEGDYSVIYDERGWIIGHFGVQQEVTNRKKTEEALLKREEELRLLFDHASDGIFINEMNQKFKEANKAALKMTGYSREELLKLRVTDILDDEDLIKSPLEIDKLNTGKKVLRERTIVKKDGSKTDVEVSSQKVGDQIIAIVRDISDRKRAELQLKENEAFLREVGRIASVGGWMYNVQDDQIYLEPSSIVDNLAKEKYTVSLANWSMMFSPASPEEPTIETLVKNCVEHQQSFDQEFRIAKNDSILWVRIIGQPKIDQNKVVTIKGTTQDITQYKEIKKNIELEKELSENVINNLPGIFYLFSQDGKLLRWNDNIEIVTGYSSEEIDHLHPLDLFAEEDHEYIASKIQSVFENGYDFAEASFIIKSGKKIPYYFTGSVINYAGQICLQGVGIDISDRVEAQKSLKLANKQLNTAQQIAKIGYWEWDWVNSHTYWSDEMYALCGGEVNKGPFPDREFTTMIHKDDRKRIAQQLRLLKKTNSKGEIEFRFFRKDGEMRYFKSIVSPVNDDQGNFLKLEGTLQDITEAKISAQKIKAYNERFNIIAQTTSDAIFEWNPISNTAWWSDSQYELFGFENENGLPAYEEWFAKIHPEDQPYLDEMIERTKTEDLNEWKMELRHIRNDGSIGSLILNAYVTRENGQPRILGGFVDISEQKDQEEIIRKSNERYELISQATNDAIWDWDLSTNMIVGNDHLYQIYNLEESEDHLSDGLFFSKVHPDDVNRVRENMGEALFDKNRVIKQEYRFLYPDNEYRIILDRAFIIYDESGLPERMLGAMQDITERKKSERELQKLTNRLLLATTSANLGIFDWNVANNKLVWNEFMYEMFDVDPSNFDHRFESWLDCLHARDLSKFNLKNHIKRPSQHHLHETIRVVLLNEDIRHIEVHAVVLSNNHGEPNSVIGVCRDITDSINSEQEIARAIINTQEEERFETGRELHDNVTQVLIAALMNLNLADEIAQGDNKMLKNGLMHTKNAIDEVRKLSHQMAPSNLGGLSLDESIRKLLEDMNSNHIFDISFESDISTDQDLAADIKLNVYRIVQEQLNNIMRHAEADKISIELEANKNRIFLRTRDNGKGFEPTKVKRGIGLNNIMRRVKVFSGEILINSSPQNGCEIILEIPLS